jgi:hypothetical protein
MSQIHNQEFPHEFSKVYYEDHVRFEDRWMVSSWCDE